MVTWMRSPSSSFMTARRPFDIHSAEFPPIGGLDQISWIVPVTVGTEITPRRPRRSTRAELPHVACMGLFVSSSNSARRSFRFSIDGAALDDRRGLAFVGASSRHSSDHDRKWKETLRTMKLSLAAVLIIVLSACGREPGPLAGHQPNEFYGPPVLVAQSLAVDTFSDVGLRNAARLRELATIICELDRDFPPHKAAERIQDALVKALDSSMPVPRVEFDDQIAYSGLFAFKEWKIKIQDNTFDYFEFDSAITSLAKIIAHELRHAEQYFMAARYSASIGIPPTDEGSYLHLPRFVIESANEQPLKEGTREFEFGRAVFEDSINPEIKATKNYLFGPSGKLAQHLGNEERLRTFNEFFEKLPTERDAFAVEQPLKRAIEACLNGKISEGYSSRLSLPVSHLGQALPPRNSLGRSAPPRLAVVRRRYLHFRWARFRPQKLPSVRFCRQDRERATVTRTEQRVPHKQGPVYG